jgi:hypothetical protein
MHDRAPRLRRAVQVTLVAATWLAIGVLAAGAVALLGTGAAWWLREIGSNQ